MPDQPLDLGAVQARHDADEAGFKTLRQMKPADPEDAKALRDTIEMQDDRAALLSVLTATRRALVNLEEWAVKTQDRIGYRAAIQIPAIRSARTALALATDAP